MVISHSIALGMEKKEANSFYVPLWGIALFLWSTFYILDPVYHYLLVGKLIIELKSHIKMI